MAPHSGLKLPYMAQYLRMNPIYTLLNLLDLCPCLKIHLNTTHTRPLSQNPLTLPVATKMASQSPRVTAAVQAGTSPFAVIVGPRKLAMRVSRHKHISWEQSTIVLGMVAGP